MDTKIKKIIFVGGLDNRAGDLNIEEQTKLVIEGYGDNVTSFRYNTSITQIKAEIENNIGSPIMLFSAGCQFSKQIADFLITLGQKLDILHIVEPYTCSENTKNIVESAIKIGLPPSNVFKGSTDCTGANINGATSNKELGQNLGINYETFHWDSLKIVSAFIKSIFEEKVEEVKNIEKKELKTYELVLKIDQEGNITNDKLGKLKIISKIEESILSGFDFGEDEQDLLLLDDEFIEAAFSGKEESELEIQEYPDEKTRKDTEDHAFIINQKTYVPGKNKLDLIPGVFFNNQKQGIQCCQIDGRPVNVNIADPLIDMIQEAKKDGISLKISSAFRPGFKPSINTKSESGVLVTASDQESLWQQNCAGRAKCSTATALPGTSRHGNGIAVDFNTGTRCHDPKWLGYSTNSSISKMDSTKEKNYQWLVKNSWRFGFLRTLKTEEWHFEYWPEKAKNGPYGILPKNDPLFYADLGLNNIQISTV